MLFTLFNKTINTNQLDFRFVVFVKNWIICLNQVNFFFSLWNPIKMVKCVSVNTEPSQGLKDIHKT